MTSPDSTPPNLTDSQQSPDRRVAPLMMQDQGIFAVGGTVIRHPGTYDSTKGGPDGQTLHGDHAQVSYQIPVAARRHPLIFVHGNMQFSRTWQTTPDGREGFQNIFLRRGFPVYLLDLPRRGNAGRSTLPATLTPTADEQAWFETFRVGLWPDFHAGVQFPRSPEALEQYFRQITPDTGPFDVQVSADAVAALLAKIAGGILVTHSQGGGIGWFAALKDPGVRAIASYEPGSNFPFPEGEVPEPMPSASGTLKAVGVPFDEFRKLTRMPIIIFYGDYIPRDPTPIRGLDNWRVRRAMAHLWAQAINRYGGNATVVDLPAIGIHGNTHFPFSDLNNLQVAEELSRFLSAHGLA